jgi:flagellum-specific ATP synthase
MKGIVEKEHFDNAGRLKENIARYQESEDLINVGAYAKGRNPQLDRAVELKVPIDSYLKQDIEDSWNFEKSIEELTGIFRK